MEIKDLILHKKTLDIYIIMWYYMYVSLLRY